MSIYFYFKLLKKIYLNTFLESKQEVLNEEEKEETMEMISKVNQQKNKKYIDFNNMLYLFFDTSIGDKYEFLDIF
ncbi:MAG TPA: hypothetical protein PLI22_03295 [Caldisericia bacterium]|nr:hypothetical protein [Caldisericia bacterium]